MQSSTRIVALCQFDHTLFDSCRYPVDSAARAALSRLAAHDVSVVLCSCRTRMQLELIQQEWGIRGPFASENGAAVFFPRGYVHLTVPGAREVAGYDVVEFGKPYPEVLATLRRVAERLRLTVMGFHDMSVDEAAAACALPLLEARLAKLRGYTEPFRIVSNDRNRAARLLRALRQAGLDWATIAPYHYLGTDHRNIGVRFLIDLLRRAPGDVRTVACCDDSGAPVVRYAGIPSVHVINAPSVAAWADALFEMADAARPPRGQHSILSA
jgi:predicted mannosyl-3-phosphoglycerate phosphatase (HAD superfamily)